MAGEFEPAGFALDFHEFLKAVNRLAPRQTSPIRLRLEQHLDDDPTNLPTVAEELPTPEHPNLQLALDELVAEDGWLAIGLPALLRQMGGFSLASVAADRLSDFGLAASRPGPVEYVSAPIGPGKTLACAQLALYLGRWQGEPLAVLVVLGDPHHFRRTLGVEVLAASRELARRFLLELTERRQRLNVYRGKTLSFTFTEHGDFHLDFVTVPTLDRSQVVLPDPDLGAIEQHTVEIANQAAVLRAAGRHLRRGLLLHGPPGTGKTLSVMYLCNRMPGRTTVLINGGPGMSLLGQAIALARAAQPSMVVLEDVDLVAQERTLPGQHSNPLLFQLLNEMDGLAEDADMIFVLTTNRLDLLEPALAARPGRIDQAVEIKLPDADCRGRLFDLYLRGIADPSVDVQDLVAATAGVSAAFVKELVRRAVLHAATTAGDDEPLRLQTRHLTDALTALDLSRKPVLRSILGAADQR